MTPRPNGGSKGKKDPKGKGPEGKGPGSSSDQGEANVLVGIWTEASGTSTDLEKAELFCGAVDEWRERRHVLQEMPVLELPSETAEMETEEYNALVLQASETLLTGEAHQYQEAEALPEEAVRQEANEAP